MKKLVIILSVLIFALIAARPKPSVIIYKHEKRFSFAAPQANAGTDQEWAKTDEKPFRLWGSGSEDADGDSIIRYTWTQINNGAPLLTIVNPNFIYPHILTYPNSHQTYLFELEIEDETNATDKDTVEVEVWPIPVYDSDDTLEVEPSYFGNFNSGVDFSSTPYLKLIGGQHNYLAMLNCTGGSIQKPIKIACTDSGDVDFRPQDGAAALTFNGTSNVWISGKNSRERYGIKIYDDSTDAPAQIDFTKGTRFEVDHVYLRGGLGRSYNSGGGNPYGYGAIGWKTYPATGYNKADGYEMTYLYCHDIRSDSFIGEHRYFGVSHYGDFTANSYTPTTTEAPTRFMYVWDDTAITGMLDIAQFQACLEGLYVGNVYYADGARDSPTVDGSHKNHLQLGPGSVGLVENFSLFMPPFCDRQAYGVSHQGQGKTIYQNGKIVGIAVGADILRNSSENITANAGKFNWRHVTFRNITIAKSSFAGVRSYTNGFSNFTQKFDNNIIAQSAGDIWLAGGGSLAALDTQGNKTTLTPSAVGFTDYAANDFTLTSSSGARAGGINFLTDGEPVDFLGNPIVLWHFGPYTFDLTGGMQTRFKRKRVYTN